MPRQGCLLTPGKFQRVNGSDHSDCCLHEALELKAELRLETGTNAKGQGLSQTQNKLSRMQIRLESTGRSLPVALTQVYNEKEQ